MKATGIVRRIDHLGRVVIPISLRRTLNISEGDRLEVFVDDDSGITFKKYSPLGGRYDLAQIYCDSLHKSSGHVVFIADIDRIIAVSGASREEYIAKGVTDEVKEIVNQSRIYMGTENGFHVLADEKGRFSTIIIAPIIAAGEAAGSVILCSKTNAKLGEVEEKLAETAAEFLGRHLSR